MTSRPNLLKNILFSAALLGSLCAFNLPALAGDSVYANLPLTDLDQRPANLEQYQGRVVLLNFWATWCPPCVKEMPSMQRLQDQFSSDQFQILAVNMGESSKTINNFFLEQEFEFSLPIYQDEKGAAFRLLDIRGMPSSFLLDREGEIIEVIVGAREWDHPESIAAVQLLVTGKAEK